LSVSISPSRAKTIVTEDNNHQVLEIKDKKDDNIGKHVVSPRTCKSTT
jgi:hypothetical protein